jgi:hypothetical protein
LDLAVAESAGHAAADGVGASPSAAGICPCAVASVGANDLDLSGRCQPVSADGSAPERLRDYRISRKVDYGDIRVV